MVRRPATRGQREISWQFEIAKVSMKVEYRKRTKLHQLDAAVKHKQNPIPNVDARRAVCQKESLVPFCKVIDNSSINAGVCPLLQKGYYFDSRR